MNGVLLLGDIFFKWKVNELSYQVKLGVTDLNSKPQPKQFIFYEVQNWASLEFSH